MSPISSATPDDEALEVAVTTYTNATGDWDVPAGAAVITKSQIYSWDPSMLTDIGNAWNSMGSDIEDLFDRYKSSVANVNGGPWEGLAADAAQARAESDRAAAIRLVDHLQQVAQIAIDGFDQINPPLERARNAISGAEQAGFFVSEDLTVSYSGEMTSSRARAMTDWQQAITYAATDAETADNEVKDALSAAREDLTVAFVSPGSLGSDQARTDANQLLDDPSSLTPEQLQRLIEAGSLTTDQLVALASGETVNIPASQMEYINALARSLDGKSSQDIEEMLNALPPEAREGMANALQLISTTSVSASVTGDSEIPTYGRANLLPQRMYESLTRDDLVTYDTQTLSSGMSAIVYDVVNLNGVADNQAAARIAGMSDITFMHGTGLDAAVLDTAAQYLHAQNAAESDDLFFVDGYGESIDAQITDEMFHAVAEDRAAVADYVSGRDGQRFLSDVFTHEWNDDGEGISELFDISSYDAVADPNNGPDWARATQSGNIAESMARYMSENSDDLLHMPDDTARPRGSATRISSETLPRIWPRTTALLPARRRFPVSGTSTRRTNLPICTRCWPPTLRRGWRRRRPPWRKKTCWPPFTAPATGPAPTPKSLARCSMPWKAGRCRRGRRSIPAMYTPRTGKPPSTRATLMPDGPPWKSPRAGYRGSARSPKP